MSIADVRRNGGSIFVLNGALDLIGNTPVDSVDFIANMLKRQGLEGD